MVVTGEQASAAAAANRKEYGDAEEHKSKLMRRQSLGSVAEDGAMPPKNNKHCRRDRQDLTLYCVPTDDVPFKARTTRRKKIGTNKLKQMSIYFFPLRRNDHLLN